MGQVDDALMVLESEPNSEKETAAMEPDFFPLVAPEPEVAEDSRREEPEGNSRNSSSSSSSKREITAQVLEERYYHSLECYSYTHYTERHKSGQFTDSMLTIQFQNINPECRAWTFHEKCFYASQFWSVQFIGTHKCCTQKP